MSTLLICNARLVNEGLITNADIFISDGRIEKISNNLAHIKSDRFIDAQGLYLLPGIIDTQFSLASSSFNKEHFLQETQAAIAGGITSIMLLPDMASNYPFGIPDADMFEQLKPILKNNLSVYELASPSALDTLHHLNDHTCAVFASMSCKYDHLRFDRIEFLEELVDISPMLVTIEAEHMPSILESEESYRQIYGDDIPLHLHSIIRGPESCLKGMKVALKAAENRCKSIHFMCISTTQEVDLIKASRKKNITVTAGARSHFLTFSKADYDGKGQLLKDNPSIKSDVDRASLVYGLLDDNINNICSGHMPYSIDQKKGSYFSTSAGLPQAQFLLPSVLEHYQDQIFTLELIVEKTSHAIANTFSIKDRGYIREGYWADLVLVDLEASFISRNEDVLSGANWTIFAGNEFRSSVIKTIVNGEVAWSKTEEDSITDSAGMMIEFYREQFD